VPARPLHGNVARSRLDTPQSDHPILCLKSAALQAPAAQPLPCRAPRQSLGQSPLHLCEVLGVLEEPASPHLSPGRVARAPGATHPRGRRVGGRRRRASRTLSGGIRQPVGKGTDARQARKSASERVFLLSDRVGRRQRAQHTRRACLIEATSPRPRRDGHGDAVPSKVEVTIW